MNESAKVATCRGCSKRRDLCPNGWCSDCCDCAENQAPTLRDQFAMAALQGLLARENCEGTWAELGGAAYLQADAMLAARKNGGAA